MTILNQDSVAGYEWESVYTLLSIPVGSEELYVQNKGSYTILVSFSADDNMDGQTVSSIRDGSSDAYTDADDP